jgi:D-alanine-D-alanine ligase
MMNEYTVPPQNVNESEIDRDACDWIMQHDVMSHLKQLAFDVRALGLSSDLAPLQQHIEEFKPHIIFNLIYEFKGESTFDQNVIAFLELLGVPYTGSNPRSLMLARNKAITKKILRYHEIPTPNFDVYVRGQPVVASHPLRFPVIVKCLAEDASLGISQASLVHSEEKLLERVRNLHDNFNSDAIAEEFIDGRELSIGIIGNEKLSSFPIWELLFENSDAPEREFYHSYAKWNNAYRKRKGIRTQKADLTSSIEHSVTHIAKKVYRALGLSGYARIDFRLASTGEIFVIEANPNPDLSLTEDFAASAKAFGLEYGQLVKKIVTLGLRA